MMCLFECDVWDMLVAEAKERVQRTRSSHQLPPTIAHNSRSSLSTHESSSANRRSQGPQASLFPRKPQQTNQIQQRAIGPLLKKPDLDSNFISVNKKDLNQNIQQNIPENSKQMDCMNRGMVMETRVVKGVKQIQEVAREGCESRAGRPAVQDMLRLFYHEVKLINLITLITPEFSVVGLSEG